MEVQPDYSELFALLNAHNVEYVVVGAHALAFHGAPRFTGDLDLFVRPVRENARRILAALAEFGFGSVNLSEKDFLAQDRVVQLGVAPVRVDFVTALSGISWDEAAAGMVAGDYGDQRVHYLGRDELIRNKRVTGRQKDLADIEALEE